MILLYAFIAWLGGILTVAGLWDIAGPVLACGLAPFGGSGLALGTALLIYLHRVPAEPAARRPAAKARQPARLLR